MVLEIGALRVANLDSSAASPQPLKPRSVELQPLHWDTAFFGRRMGRLSMTGDLPVDVAPPARRRLVEEDLRAVLQEAADSGYAHLLMRVPAEDLVLAS